MSRDLSSWLGCFSLFLNMDVYQLVTFATLLSKKQFSIGVLCYKPCKLHRKVRDRLYELESRHIIENDLPKNEPAAMSVLCVYCTVQHAMVRRNRQVLLSDMLRSLQNGQFTNLLHKCLRTSNCNLFTGNFQEATSQDFMETDVTCVSLHTLF